jgi:hypothetical protein
MAKNAKIVVNSGATLNVDGGIITSSSGCSEMWDGIVVNNNGKLYVQNNARIEDAEIGAEIQYGAYYYLNNSTFNRNYVHVKKTMPPSGTPLLTSNYRILKCKFLCQTTASIGGTAVYEDLLPPHANQRTSTAILAWGVPKILVGSTSAANANTITNCDWGTVAWGVKKVEVIYNTLKDIGNKGVEAAYGPGLGGETITIDNNSIYRTPFPIFCHDNDTTVRTRIRHNSIDFNGMVSPPTYMTGITVSEVTPAPGGGKYNFADISYNEMFKAPCGISLSNLYGDQVGNKGRLYVGDNEISHSKPDDNVQAGILLSNVTQPVIVENTIGSPTGYLHWAETGIRMSGGGDIDLYCNATHNVGRGIWVDGTIAGINSFVRTEMDNSQTGLLLNYGVIGVQGSSTLPHDNID